MRVTAVGTILNRPKQTEASAAAHRKGPFAVDVAVEALTAEVAVAKLITTAAVLRFQSLIPCRIYYCSSP